jgi:hypothetical protein
MIAVHPRKENPMRIFALFALAIAGSLLGPRIFPQTDPPPIHPHLPGQNACEKNFIKLTEAHEMHEGRAYERLLDVAHRFHKDDAIPHIYIIPPKKGDTGYLTGSIFTQESDHRHGKVMLGKIFLSQTDLDDYGDTDALEGLLGRQMAYLVNDKGNRPCVIYNTASHSNIEEIHADEDAAEYVKPKPVIEFLTRLKELLSARDDSVAVETINGRLNGIRRMEPPPDPQNSPQ